MVGDKGTEPDQPGPAEAEIRAECNALADMLCEKNRRYGNSALEPCRVFSNAPADEQIRVRMDDKLSRLLQGQTDGEDALMDLLGYYVLLRIVQRRAVK